MYPDIRVGIILDVPDLKQIAVRGCKAYFAAAKSLDKVGKCYNKHIKGPPNEAIDRGGTDDLTQVDLVSEQSEGKREAVMERFCNKFGTEPLTKESSPLMARWRCDWRGGRSRIGKERVGHCYGKSSIYWRDEYGYRIWEFQIHDILGTKIAAEKKVADEPDPDGLDEDAVIFKR